MTSDDIDGDHHFSTPVLQSPWWLTAAVVEKFLWILPIVGVVVGAITRAWTSDDGFAYFRTVEQILAGNGPVFNADERVEAFTSPLWLLLLIVGDVLSPIRLEYVSAALSISCTLAGLVLTTLASAHLSRFDRPAGVRLPLGLVVVAALWPIWVWATSGLEVGLCFAWIGACFYVLTRWSSRQAADVSPAARADGEADDDPDPPSEPTVGDGTTELQSDGPPIATTALVLLGLGWLVRPELVLSSALFVGVAVTMSTQERRRRWRMAAIASAIPLAYQVFRMGYYGLLASSPSIAKEDFATRPGRGWAYFTNFVGPYVLVIPLLVILFAIGGPLIRSLSRNANRRPLVVAGLVAASGALQILSVIMFGGDYVHARRLLPGLFALLAPFFVVAASRRYIEGLLVTFGWAVVCLLWLRPSDDPADGIGTGFPGEILTYQDRGFEQRGIDQSWIDGPGVYLASAFGATAARADFAGADPDAIVVIAAAVGPFGYVLGPDARIIDVYGSTDPLIAHQRLAFGSVPGHEKVASGPWLVAMLAADPANVPPELVVSGSGWFPDPPTLDYLHEVAWASAALRCNAIEVLSDTSVEPFGAGTLLSNVRRSVSNTTIRIDRSPRHAYIELCGDDIPAEVAAFYERAELTQTLRGSSGQGDIVVAGECGAVFLGTGDDDNAWRPIQADALEAKITMEPDDPVPGLAAVFVAGPYDTSVAVVWVETDGLGNYRLRQDVEWFPPAFQPWTPIPENGIVRVAMSPDLTTRQWLVSRPFVLQGVPMEAAGDDASTAIVPVAAGPSGSAGSITVEFEEAEPGRTCQAILDHHQPVDVD